MKSPNALLFVAVLAASALAGCGQTGPLYMPKPPARPAAQAHAVPAQEQAPTPTSTTVPAAPPVERTTPTN
ncbi:LPS translocon maturation chaperone LptM [Massilia sp. SYSU DXS3249]